MRRLLPFLALLLAMLVGAASATASGRDVIRDCTDDEVMSKTYTQEEYREALREFAAAGDADQYGNCRDIIRRAQQAALAASRRGGASGSGDSGGGATPSGGAGAIGSPPAAQQLGGASDAERAAVEQARTAPATVVSLDRASIDPARVGTVPGLSQVSDLPAPLAVLLALLLAGALAIGSLRIRRLVHARRA